MLYAIANGTLLPQTPRCTVPVPRCVYFVPFQNLKNAPTYTVHNELKTFMHTSVEIWHFEINCYVFQQIALLQSSPASKVLEQSVNK